MDEQEDQILFNWQNASIWEPYAGSIRTRYKITPRQRDRLWCYQGGVCAICKGKPKADKNGKRNRLEIDHDHKTGKVRGLLCKSCNLRLHEKAKPEKFASYLTNPPATKLKIRRKYKWE